MPFVVPRMVDVPSDRIIYTESAESLVAGRGLAFRPGYGVQTPIWEPMRNWPPGYTVLVAGLHAMGISSYAAAIALNLLFAAAGIVVLSWLAHRLLPPEAALLATGASVGMHVYVFHSAVGSTDLPFVVLVAGAMACVVKGIETGRWQWGLAAGVLAGVSFTFRYVGVTAIAATLVPLAMYAWQERGAARWKLAAAWSCAVAAIAGPLVIYNLAATGRIIPYAWAANRQATIDVLRDTAMCVFFELTTSNDLSYRLADKYIVAGLLAVLLAVVVWLLVTRRPQARGELLLKNSLLVMMMLFAGLYMAALLSSRLKYHLTDGGVGVWDRYLLPVLWIVWFLVAIVIYQVLLRTWLSAVWQRGILAAILLAIVAVQANRVTGRLLHGSPPRATLQAWLGGEAANHLATVHPDQFVLCCRLDLMRELAGVHSRGLSPAEFDTTILRNPTREELRQAGDSGLLWGVVIDREEAVRRGVFGPMWQELLDHPERYPEFERVALEDSVPVFRYRGVRTADSP